MMAALLPSLSSALQSFGIMWQANIEKSWNQNKEQPWIWTPCGKP